jgi:signal transduction histidine kinase
VGEVLDVTERKMADEALSTVNRRLLETQEQERARIARELHDDISQRLALLTIGMEQIRRDTRPVEPELRERLEVLCHQVGEIASDLHAIAYRLHSPKLEYIGLVAAVRSFCRESSLQQSVEIDFTHSRVPAELSQEVSLTLFRVLQESLHNATKHSGVRNFTVQLLGTPREIALHVSDGGAGFDPKAAKNQKGLGLISMRERVSLVDGTISITSRPNGGTTIAARVPLKPLPAGPAGR